MLEEYPIIGIVKIIDFQVESNKKYAVPFYLHCTGNFSDGTLNLEIENYLANNIILDKNDESIHSDYLDYVLNNIPFHSEIISIAKKIIPSLQRKDIIRSEFLLHTGQYQLKKLFRNVGLQSSSKIRIYFNGHLSIYPTFYIFNKENNKECKDIEKKLNMLHFITYFTYICCTLVIIYCFDALFQIEWTKFK